MADYFTYRDLAALFGIAERRVRERMGAWQAEGFPCPLPWCQHQKRWNREAVLAWKARREIAARARNLSVVSGASHVQASNIAAYPPPQR